MCGIFGACALPQTHFTSSRLRKITDELFRLSESRGKEAAGLAIRNQEQLSVFKRPMAASKFIRNKPYQRFFDDTICSNGSQSNSPLSHPITFIGHSRLTTNGLQYINYNNQPVINEGFVGVHNGIITNESAIRERLPQLSHQLDVDTEVILSLLRHYYLKEGDIVQATRSTYQQIMGTAAIAVLAEDLDSLILSTNCGSLYFGRNRQQTVLFFSSERFILEQLLRFDHLEDEFGEFTITPIKANSGFLVGIDDLSLHPFLFDEPPRQQQPTGHKLSPLKIADYSEDEERARRALHRCTRCVLPETVPFITFDDEGVCNFCRDYQPMEVLPVEDLDRQLGGIRSSDGNPDCIVMLSGGRDSSYGLHYIKKVLGMNPIAYTYDWGVITDLARRNSARMCGQLGVEHILVSADIARKRRYVRQNIQAWMKNPNLGMIPLFMAGDKQYYYYANRLRQQTGIETIFVCESPLELTKFKAGFCGIEEGNRRLFDITIIEKLQLARYYAGQYLRNPSYLNASFLDSLFAYFSSYMMSHDYIFLYKYHRWDEQQISSTLIDEYDWELAPDTRSTWRIGDGTAPFYNYIYYTVAGFTENDTLHSNQVREGVLSRDEAILLTEEENRPRWESIEWYARTIGFDLDEALATIHSMPKLYLR